MFNNNNEFRVFGLMRSGNHAIIEWIISQFPSQKLVFINNLKFGNHDPYKNSNGSFLKGFKNNTLEEIRDMYKDVLIYSYEDNDTIEKNENTFLESINDINFDKNIYFGKSKNTRDILIIRDPFNLFASRLEMISKRGALGGIKNPEIILRIWIEIAKLALDWENAQSCLNLVIKYNKWAIDEDYRKNLSNILGGRFSDKSMTSVPNYGGGSSFDNNKLVPLKISAILNQFYKVFRINSYTKIGFYWKRFWLPTPNPQKHIFERWKHYENNPVYLNMISNPEVLDLSRKLFGVIQGTEKFYEIKSHK